MSAITWQERVIWSLVRGPSPQAHAVEPGMLGLDVPGDVLVWADRQARQHGHTGFNTGEPDLYLLVAPADQPHRVEGALAGLSTSMDAADLAELRAALKETDNPKENAS